MKKPAEICKIGCGSGWYDYFDSEYVIGCFCYRFTIYLVSFGSYYVVVVVIIVRMISS